MATDLNKLAGEIDKRRKDVKKELSMPVDVFNTQAVELATLILNSREKILKQVAVFEDKQKAHCKQLLQLELDTLYLESEVTKEYQTGNIENLAILSNLTEKAKLTKGAVEKVAEMVKTDKNVQDMVESRKANLSATTERAGLFGGISDTLIMPFIREPESIYTAKLNQIIDAEIKRQKVTEERIKDESERKAKDEAEKVERETKARELEAARKLAQAVDMAVERDNAAKEAERKQAQAEIDHENRKVLLEQAQKQAAEATRKASIERAMLEMERAELEAAKEVKKTELTRDCKVFIIDAQIKMRCAVDSTQTDAKRLLEEYMIFNNCTVVKIESIIG